jgi:uncharacterized protein YciI
MPYFFVKLTAPRPSFAFDMTEDERALMQAHSAYWRALLDKGNVLVFGPVLDPKGPFGVCILAAWDEVEARKVAADDPVIKAGLGFQCDVFTMGAVVRQPQSI